MAKAGYVGLRIPLALRAQIQRQAEIEQRNFSQMARILLARGLTGAGKGKSSKKLKIAPGQ